jgi:hypothetical protein
VVVDGKAYTLAQNLPGTGGVENKKYVVTPAIKGKIWQLFGTGTGLQIYSNDCEFRIKPWGASQYATVKPIGDLNVTSGGARI